MKYWLRTGFFVWADISSHHDSRSHGRSPLRDAFQGCSPCRDSDNRHCRCVFWCLGNPRFSRSGYHSHNQADLGSHRCTFLTKFLVAMTFVVPVLLLSLSTAIVVNLIWGMSILSVLSYIIAKSKGEPAWKIVGDHLLIAIVVISITHWLGDWIGTIGAWTGTRH